MSPSLGANSRTPMQSRCITSCPTLTSPKDHLDPASGAVCGRHGSFQLLHQRLQQRGQAGALLVGGHRFLPQQLAHRLEGVQPALFIGVRHYALTEQSAPSYPLFYASCYGA